MVRTATRKLFCHVFINRKVKTKIFSCGHFYFIGCFSADKIVVAGNRMVTDEISYFADEHSVFAIINKIVHCLFRQILIRRFLSNKNESLCFVAFSEQSVNELVCRNAKPFALYLVKANSANLSFIRLIISALCLANLKVQRFMVRQCIFERKCSIQIPLAGGIDSS